MADYSRAIQLTPADATAYVMVGIMFVSLGKLPEALSYLEEAAQLGDTDGMQGVALLRQILGT